MQRLRGNWLALLGGALLVLLSVSVAVGADPAIDDSRGQSIAGFVHSLVFDDPPADDEVTTGDESDEDEDADEATEDEDAPDEDEATDDEDLDADDAADEEAQASDVSGAEHGACVSEVAHSDDVGGANENHGGAVSEAARETCWEDEATEEEPTEPDAEGTEEFKNHGQCVSEVAHSDDVGGRNDNHGGAVSEAARETCREDGDEEPTEASVTSDGAVLDGGNGNGNGRGQGHGHGHKP